MSADDWRLQGGGIGGIQVTMVQLRDWFAGQALAGGRYDARDVYLVADTVLSERPAGAREAKRHARLAEIGELAVKEWTGATHADNADLREAIEQYLDDYMRTKTDPAPEPAGTVAEGVLERGAHPAGPQVGARRNADNEHRDLAVLVRDANGEDELT